MKGGIAAMVFAVATLASLRVELEGDLVVATNTDEESSGAGGTALVARGLEADAGILTEPTGFDTKGHASRRRAPYPGPLAGGTAPRPRNATP